MSRKLIVSAFPGLGKTHLCNSNEEILDLDSSSFSWDVNKDGQKVRSDNFPYNYMNAISQNTEGYSIVCVSSHKNVRESLIDTFKDNKDIKVVFVYPNKNLKSEYLQRYKDRGNEQSFIDMMDKNWDSFIDELDNESSEYSNILYVKISTDNYYLSDLHVIQGSLS